MKKDIKSAIKKTILDIYEIEEIINLENFDELANGQIIKNKSFYILNYNHHFSHINFMLNQFFNIDLNICGWEIPPCYEYHQHLKSPLNDDENFFLYRYLITSRIFGGNNKEARKKLLDKITLKNGDSLSKYIRIGGGAFENKNNSKEGLILTSISNYLLRVYENTSNSFYELQELENHQENYGYQKNDSLILSLDDLKNNISFIIKSKKNQKVFIDYIQEKTKYYNVFFIENEKDDLLSIINSLDTQDKDCIIKQIEIEIRHDYLQEKLIEKNSNCMTKLNKKGGKI